MSSLDIIIPVYNEKDNILAVLESLERLVKTSFRVLICYDNDEDDTLPVIRDHARFTFSTVPVKNLRRGVHGAIVTGFEASDAPAVLVFPADDIYNAGIIDKMYEKFRQGCDIVAASRFIRGGCMRRCPWLKAFLVRMASFTLYWLAGIPIHDVTSGFRLFSRRIINDIKIESSEGFTYSLELLVKCHRLGWKIDEVPALWFERTSGKSRFRVMKWLPYYLRWYAYGFATRYLCKGPNTVKMAGSIPAVQDKDAERRLFDMFGAERDYDVFDDNGYERIIGEFFKYFQPRPGLKVADLGCGTGAFTSRFLKYNFELYGIDISPKCIEYAARKYPNIRFEVRDIERTGYQDETFDVVFLSGVLHHFPDFSAVIKECRRILKKDGVLLGYDPNKGNSFMRLFRCKDSPFYISKGVTKNERPLAKNEITAVLSECGFSDYNAYGIAGVSYKYVDSKASFLILPIYNFLDKTLDMFPLRRRFGSFLVTYARKGTQ